jgi:CBS-domain-containing membrane protein
MKRLIIRIETIRTQPPSIHQLLFAWLGAFGGIFIVSKTHNTLLAQNDLILLIGSFGASAVLLYGAPHSPLARSWNLIVGHIISALVGVTFYRLLPNSPSLAAALAVATAICAMQLTHSVHPPGGATALIAVIGSAQVHELGYGYVFMPVAVGALALWLFAQLMHGLTRLLPTASAESRIIRRD